MWTRWVRLYGPDCPMSAGRARNLDCPDKTFDVVVCFGGPLSYVCDRRHQAAAELVRVTRPGGLLLVSVMSRFGATCNVVRRATLDVLRDPVAGKVWSVLDEGELSRFPSRVPGEKHPPMHLYSSGELAALSSRATCSPWPGQT